MRISVLTNGVHVFAVDCELQRLERSNWLNHSRSNSILLGNLEDKSLAIKTACLEGDARVTLVLSNAPVGGILWLRTARPSGWDQDR